MSRLFPKCHPYYNVDGEIVENKRKMGPAYTATGYMLPCCFCDTGNSDWKKEFEFYGLWSEHLKVENVESIQDILTSDEWYDFHKMLIDNPEAAPQVCKLKCSIEHTDPKKVIEYLDGKPNNEF